MQEARTNYLDGCCLLGVDEALLTRGVEELDDVTCAHLAYLLDSVVSTGDKPIACPSLKNLTS